MVLHARVGCRVRVDDDQSAHRPVQCAAPVRLPAGWSACSTPMWTPAGWSWRLADAAAVARGRRSSEFVALDCRVGGRHGRSRSGAGHPRRLRAGGAQLPGVPGITRDRRAWTVPTAPVSWGSWNPCLDRWAKSSLFWVVSNFRPFLKFTGRTDLVDAAESGRRQAFPRDRAGSWRRR